MKPLMLVFDTNSADRRVLCQWLNSRSEILNWVAPQIPNMLILTSSHSAPEISAIIHQQFPLKHFLVAEISASTSHGWISREVWDHIKAPRSSGRWKEGMRIA